MKRHLMFYSNSDDLQPFADQSCVSFLLWPVQQPSFLWMPHFDALSSADELMNLRSALSEIIGGWVKCHNERSETMRPTAVLEVAGEKKTLTLDFVRPYAADALPNDPKVRTQDVSDDAIFSPPPNPGGDESLLSRIVRTALIDTDVRAVLKLLSQHRKSWVELYRIYEKIAGPLGGDQEVRSLGWASRESIRKFKHTANSPGAVGDLARHGHLSSDAPNEPMSLVEAQLFIRSIVTRWAEKVSA